MRVCFSFARKPYYRTCYYIAVKFTTDIKFIKLLSYFENKLGYMYF